jgi:hypothetical protein
VRVPTYRFERGRKKGRIAVRPFYWPELFHVGISRPTPDKQDKCVNEAIFCQKNAENSF